MWADARRFRLQAVRFVDGKAEDGVRQAWEPKPTAHQSDVANELIRAYMGAGREIFDDEDKYFAFLKPRLEPPSGGS